MEPEKSIEVEHAALAATLSDRDGGARIVIVGLAMRHDDIEAIDRAAQEDDDDSLAAGITFERARRPGIGAEQQDSRGGDYCGAAEKFAASLTPAPFPLGKGSQKRRKSCGRV